MKKAFRFGLIGGFIAGVLVAITMDFAFRDALGGSWADAVRHDLSLIFGRPLTNNSILVIAGVMLVVGLVGAFGALIGAVVGVFLYRLFSLLRN